MKRALVLLIALSILSPLDVSAYVDGEEVLYIGGTLPRIQPGALGKFDTTLPDALVFTTGDHQVTLFYKSVSNVEYSRKIARRFGVIGTIAVVLAKPRQRKHYLAITYKDDVGTPQVARFEVSKHQAPILMDILRGRSPRAFAQTLPPQRQLRR